MKQNPDRNKRGDYTERIKQLQDAIAKDTERLLEYKADQSYRGRGLTPNIRILERRIKDTQAILNKMLRLTGHTQNGIDERLTKFLWEVKSYQGGMPDDQLEVDQWHLVERFPDYFENDGGYIKLKPIAKKLLSMERNPRGGQTPIENIIERLEYYDYTVKPFVNKIGQLRYNVDRFYRRVITGATDKRLRILADKARDRYSDHAISKAREHGQVNPRSANPSYKGTPLTSKNLKEIALSRTDNAWRDIWNRVSRIRGITSSKDRDKIKRALQEIDNDWQRSLDHVRGLLESARRAESRADYKRHHHTYTVADYVPQVDFYENRLKLFRSISNDILESVTGERNPRDSQGSYADEHAATELFLYVNDDGDLYRSQGRPIEDNLARKMKRGIYDSEKAIKLVMYLMESGAKKYHKEFGDRYNSQWHTFFDKPTREAAAREWLEHHIETIQEKAESLKGGKVNPRGNTAQYANREAVKYGIDFNKSVYELRMSDLTFLAKLAKQVGYRKSKSSPRSLGAAFYLYLQKQVFSSARNSYDATDFFDDKVDQISAEFTGEISGSELELEAPDGTPKKLARLGHLRLVKIRDGDNEYDIKFGDNEDAYLAADRRKNLYFVGRDANAKGIIKLPKKGQKSELGQVIQIDYFTTKRHIESGKPTYFYHELGEVDGFTPVAYIDSEGFITLYGGNYDIWPCGIVN